MKVSNKNYSIIESNILKFLKVNNFKTVSIQFINTLHSRFCLSIREPTNINVQTIKENYVFIIDSDYFNDFYLNDKSLNDEHLETVFKKILNKFYTTI